MARLSSESDLDDFAVELSDRFGAPPEPVEQLLELARVRIWAHQRGVQAIHREDNYAVLTASHRAPLELLRTASEGRLRLADQRSAYLPLDGAAGDAQATLAQVKALLRPAAVAS